MTRNAGSPAKRWVERHAFLWGSICFIVGTLPQWISSVWSLRSSEPLLVVAGRQPWGNLLPTFSPWFVSVPLGLLMFSALWWRARKEPPQSSADEGNVRIADSLAAEVLDPLAPTQVPIVRMARTLDNVRLEWFLSDSGDLLIRAISGDVEPVYGFELSVVGMKKRGSSGAFADVADFHHMQRLVIGKADLFHEQKERFVFLSRGHDAVRFQGNTSSGFKNFIIRQQGVWKVELTLEVSGIVRSRELTFRWEEPVGLQPLDDASSDFRSLSELKITPVLGPNTRNYLVVDHKDQPTKLVNDFDLDVCFQNGGDVATLLTIDYRCVDDGGNVITAGGGGLLTVAPTRVGDFKQSRLGLKAKDLVEGKFVIPGHSVTPYFLFRFGSYMPLDVDRDKNLTQEVLLTFLGYTGTFLITLDVPFFDFKQIVGNPLGE